MSNKDKQVVTVTCTQTLGLIVYLYIRQKNREDCKISISAVGGAKALVYGKAENYEEDDSEGQLICFLRINLRRSCQKPPG